MIEHELTLILAEQLATFVNSFMINVSFTKQDVDTTIEPNKLIKMTSDNYRHSSDAKIYIYKTGRTKFWFNFTFTKDEMDFKEILNNVVSGYTATNQKLNNDSTYNYSFTIDMGCKSNAVNFFDKLVTPHENKIIDMI